MHRGVVHDDGPLQMVPDPRIGIIYLFPHEDGSGDVIKPFKNKPPEEDPCTRGQVVELEENGGVKFVGNRVRVRRILEDHERSDEDVKEGLVAYESWKENQSAA